MTSACRAWWLKRWPRWRHTKHFCRMKYPLARKHRRWRRRRRWAWKTNANVLLNLCIAGSGKGWGRGKTGSWDGKSLVKGIGLCRSQSLEPKTTPYSWPGVFTDRTIFSLNLSQTQNPTGTSVTNCNHKHGLMLTCRHDVDMFTWGRIVLSLPKRAHVDWNWPISREKYLKVVALAYYGSCRLLAYGRNGNQ